MDDWDRRSDISDRRYHFIFLVRNRISQQPSIHRTTLRYLAFDSPTNVKSVNGIIASCKRHGNRINKYLN